MAVSAVSSRSALRSLMPTALATGGDGVVAVGDGGEDLELDRGHQGGALPIGLRHLLQPRGVESWAVSAMRFLRLPDHSARA